MRIGTGDLVSGGLAILGALNWGLIGLFGFNLVRALFGWSKPIERLVYATVGLAGAWFAFAMARTMGLTR